MTRNNATSLSKQPRPAHTLCVDAGPAVALLLPFQGAASLSLIQAAEQEPA